MQGRLRRWVSSRHGFGFSGEQQTLFQAHGARPSRARRMRAPPPADPRLNGWTKTIGRAEFSSSSRYSCRVSAGDLGPGKFCRGRNARPGELGESIGAKNQDVANRLGESFDVAARHEQFWKTLGQKVAGTGSIVGDRRQARGELLEDSQPETFDVARKCAGGAVREQSRKFVRSIVGDKFNACRSDRTEFSPNHLRRRSSSRGSGNVHPGSSRAPAR